MGDIVRYIHDNTVLAPPDDTMDTVYGTVTLASGTVFNVPVGSVPTNILDSAYGINTFDGTGQATLKRVAPTPTTGNTIRYYKTDGEVYLPQSVTPQYMTEVISAANIVKATEEAAKKNPRNYAIYSTFVTPTEAELEAGTQTPYGTFFESQLGNKTEFTIIRLAYGVQIFPMSNATFSAPIQSQDVYGIPIPPFNSKDSLAIGTFNVTLKRDALSCRQFVQLSMINALQGGQQQIVLAEAECYGLRPDNNRKIYTACLFFSFDNDNRERFRIRVKINNELIIDEVFDSPLISPPEYKQSLIIGDTLMYNSLNQWLAFSVGDDQDPNPDLYEPKINHLCQFFRYETPLTNNELNEVDQQYKRIDFQNQLAVPNSSINFNYRELFTTEQQKFYKLVVYGKPVINEFQFDDNLNYPGTDELRAYLSVQTASRGNIPIADFRKQYDSVCFVPPPFGFFQTNFAIKPLGYNAETLYDYAFFHTDKNPANVNPSGASVYVHARSALFDTFGPKAYPADSEVELDGRIRGTANLIYIDKPEIANFRDADIDMMGILVTDFFSPDDAYDNPTVGCPDGIPPNERVLQDFNPKRLGDTLKFSKRLRGTKSTPVINTYFTDLQNLLTFYVDNTAEYSPISTVIDANGYRFTNAISEGVADAKVKS